MEILALVPLRGGSKSIPHKNIKEIAGKPLCAWALEAAVNAQIFDRIVVSTDSEEISAVVRSLNLGVEILPRPSFLATDETPTEAVMLHAAEHYRFDVLTTIQATSPLVTAKDFSMAWQQFQREGLNSLLTGVRVKRFFWTEEGPLNYDPQKRPRRQEFKGVFVENGAFYMTERKILEQYRCRLGGKIGIYEMPADTIVEIDEPRDWETVETLLRAKAAINISEILKDVRLLAFDCDGVLTDGGMYYGENGEELKKFNTRDGQGLELIRSLGIKSALITRENSEAARKRAEKLKIDELFLAVLDKEKPLRILLDKYRLQPGQIAYIGDDIGDIPAMEMAGISFAVADAVDLVKRKARFVLNKKGGEGAVREVCDYIIRGIARPPDHSRDSMPADL